MAGAMRRMGEYLGLVEQADDYDDPAYGAAYDDAPAPRAATAVQAAPRPVSTLQDRRPAPAVSTVDFARIEKITPRTYNDARTIGESFRSGVPVIMNLSDIDDDDAKRLVDFAAGLAFALRGSFDKVATKVFLLSPADVEVTPEERRRMAEAGFYAYQ